MKTIYKLFILALISSGGLFYSCETTELELLATPNALADDQADPDLLLNSIQRAYVGNIITFNDRSAEVTRIDYMNGRDYFAAYNSSTFDAVWSRFFSGTTGGGVAQGMSANINVLEAQSIENTGLTFHLGVSKTLQAHNLMLLVDFLGDIPWSEALNPLEFPSPSVDDDASVYSVARALLDEAKTYFAQTSTAPGTVTDFFYNGDIDNWNKLVNTLIMRHALTTGDNGAFNAIVASGDFIDETAEDFQFDYGTQLLNPNTRHPDYNADYTTSGANIYQSNWLMETMQEDDLVNGDDDDPRIRYYFFRQDPCTPGASCDPDGNGETLSCSLETPPTHYSANGVSYCWLEDGYWGRDHGDDDGTPPDNFTRTAVGVYPAGGMFDDNRFDGLNQDTGGVGAGTEPIILASYVDFWRAEVALASGNVGGAAGFVEAGLTKSMAKVISFGELDATRDVSFEPDAATVSAFVAAKAALITDTSDDSWNVLAEQYFVTMYGGAGDAYNFYRRTGYPTTVKPNIEPNPGVFMRTFLYPSVEVIANPNIEQRLDNADQVFWDTKPAGPSFPSAN